MGKKNVPQSAPDAKSKPRKRRKRAFFAGFLFASVLGILSFLLLDKAMGPMSTPDFCGSCHEMKDVHASWKASPHYTNSSGISVGCVACHLPPRENAVAHLTAKAAAGARDVFAHFFSVYDADAARERALRTLPGERCLHCHGNLIGQPSSPAVQIVHATSLDTPSSSDYGCITCHDALHGPRMGSVAEEREYEKADNSLCFVCHVNFKKDPLVTDHLAAGVPCMKCHGPSFDHMDDENNTTHPDTMYAKAKVNAACMVEECHPRARMEREIGHRPFFSGAEKKNVICTDCHGAHRLEKRKRRWDRETGRLIEMNGVPIEEGAEIPVDTGSMGMM